MNTNSITGGKMSVGSKFIHIRVNDKLHKSLNRKAKETHRTVSQNIRDILSTSEHPLEIDRWQSGLPVTLQTAKEQMTKNEEDHVTV